MAAYGNIEKWNEAKLHLCDIFKISSLRREQEEAIRKIVEDHRDVYVSLPTGYGKSFIYQAVPIVADIVRGHPAGRSKVIIISPLKALMDDQEAYLSSLGLSAVAVNSDQSDDVLGEIERGKYPYVFLSPEKMLSSERWRQLLGSKEYQQNLVAIAIDEAHCISQWGLGSTNPFRAWYGNLGEIKSLVSNRVCFVALTATATKHTKEQILKTLNLNNAQTFFIEQNPNKPNLCYSVQYVDNSNPLGHTFGSTLNELTTKGIETTRTMIFCQTRRQCAVVFAVFRRALENNMFVNREEHVEKRLVEMFHAGTPKTVKQHIEKNMSLVSGHIRVLVCTIAFGMGINCKGVSQIIHFGPSKTVESYVQESGRAGRDGESSKCILLYNGFLSTHCHDDMKSYMSSETCRRAYLFSHFPGTFQPGRKDHSCCDLCAGSCDCSTNCTACQSLKLDVSTTPCVSTGQGSLSRPVSSMQRSELRNKLVVYMKKLMLTNSSGGHIIGLNILNEFGYFQIEQVLSNAEKIFSLEDVYKYVEVWRKVHANVIMGCFQEVFNDVNIDVSYYFDEDVIEEESMLDNEDWVNVRDDSCLHELFSESAFAEMDTDISDIGNNSNLNTNSFIEQLLPQEE